MQDKESKLQDVTYQLRQQIIQFESLKATHENSGEARERMRYEWLLTLECVQREHVELKSIAEELNDQIKAKDEANTRLVQELEICRRQREDKLSESRVYEGKVKEAIFQLKERLNKETTKLGLMRERCAELCIQVEDCERQKLEWEKQQATLELELKEVRMQVAQNEDLIRQKEDETACVRQELAPLIAKHAEAVQRVEEEAEKKVREALIAQEELVAELKAARDENHHLNLEMRKRTSILKAIDSRLDHLSERKSE